MTNAHRWSRPSLGIALVATTVAAWLAPRPAGAQDDALERAFLEGLGDDASPGAARLVLRRSGTSLELGAAGDEGGGLALTCLLCTAAEQEARAFELGATLARGGDPAGPGEAPGLPATDVRARRTGVGPPRLPILLGGAGLALAAAGTALLLFDGGCASPERDAAGNCASLHALGPAGWPLVGAGAAAVVAAVVLWALGGMPAEGSGPEVVP